MLSLLDVITQLIENPNNEDLSKLADIHLQNIKADIKKIEEERKNESRFKRSSIRKVF